MGDLKREIWVVDYQDGSHTWFGSERDAREAAGANEGCVTRFVPEAPAQPPRTGELWLVVSPFDGVTGWAPTREGAERVKAAANELVVRLPAELFGQPPRTGPAVVELRRLAMDHLNPGTTDADDLAWVETGAADEPAGRRVYETSPRELAQAIADARQPVPESTELEKLSDAWCQYQMRDMSQEEFEGIVAELVETVSSQARPGAVAVTATEGVSSVTATQGGPALGVPESTGREWVAFDPADPPEQDTFAWLLWHGVVQEQPWEWCRKDDDEELAWHFGESSMGHGDWPSHYMPWPIPAPPRVDGGEGG